VIDRTGSVYDHACVALRPSRLTARILFDPNTPFEQIARRRA
jgi:hypothetical protein